MINTLVLSGGGVNGIIHIGAIKAIQKYLPFIKNYYGTSIGSILCTFLSICYTYNELYDIIISLNFDNYFNINIKNLYYNCYVDTSYKFIKLINSIIYCKLNIYNPTFKILYEKTNKILKINGSNLTTSTNDIFSYNTTPDMNILDAIKISICVPFIFKPVLYNNNLYIDGGLFNNYLINEVKNKKYTLGICLSNLSNINNNNINNIIHYIDIIYNSFYNYKLNFDIYKYQNITILIKNNINILKQNLSKNDKNNLINIGYDKTFKYLKKRFNKLKQKRLKQKYFFLLKNKLLRF
jgi:NTE family protein